MKKLIILLAASVLVLQGTANEKSVSVNTNGQELLASKRGEITSQDITAYLVENGYYVQTTPVHISGTNNWYAYTSKGRSNYKTYVFTDGYSILGHEDIPI